MTSLLADDVDYGTNTSVSGNWADNSDEDADDGALSSAVLMVVITGQELLSGKIGAEETQQAIDRCMKRVIHAVDIFGGRIIETRQSGIIVDFGQSDAALQSDWPKSTMI